MKNKPTQKNKKIKKSIKKSYEHRLFEDLMKYTTDVIYFKDKTGKLIMVNEAHAKGLGLVPEKVIGKTDFDIFERPRAEKMSKDDEYVIKTGKPIIDKIERATRPDGEDNYVSTTKIPRYDKNGKIIGLIGITRDITQRKQIEILKEGKKAIEKKLEILQELGRLKSEFVAVVSHELRTPLAIVREAVALISEELVGDINQEQKKLLNSAVINVVRLQKMIDDLLDISRIERGVYKLFKTVVDIVDLIKETSQFYLKQAQAKGIELEYLLPENKIPLVIDKEKINQVLTNIINNAIKFTEAGGRITVKAEADDAGIKLEVSDTGIGIAKQDLPKLFNKFVQISDSQDIKIKGLGLGLSIAKEIISRHGGNIGVFSTRGIGSKFYFTLPVKTNTLENALE
ncbi:MAG: PAS domain-containing sensor histidine kinase [Candidatus Omnitrophota bacterium]